MPYSTRNDAKTYYEVSGEGYPLVLMHANPFDRRMFLYQTAHFSTHFKVINIDLRGYGYSDKPATPITMAATPKRCPGRLVSGAGPSSGPLPW